MEQHSYVILCNVVMLEPVHFHVLSLGTANMCNFIYL